ncbi:MAG: bis(5'-nucleosyl)-tetraphosphatase (symmetrical) YqeK [Chloroflexi bacterium]|nr:bis(5'-nucleosyl)-tetraphosphatase (symmetrical) YqeK [Chloroflexota bacterium]
MDLTALARERLGHLPLAVLEHCQRVSATARTLARRFGVDEERAALAGLLHDVARAFSAQELLAAAVRYDLPVDPVAEQVPVLLHGPVGAAWVRQTLGMTDEEVLAAITWHSTGHAGMSALEKVVLLADKLEPEKGEHTTGLEQVAAAVQHDLDAALLAYFDWQIRHLLDRGALLHPATVLARNALLEERRAAR